MTTTDADTIALRAQLRARGLTHEQIDDALSHDSAVDRRAAASASLTVACDDHTRAAAFFAGDTSTIAKKIAGAVALVTASEIDPRIVDLVQATRRVRDLRAELGGSIDHTSSERSLRALNAGNGAVYTFVERVLREVMALEAERVGLVLQAAERG